MFAFSTIAIVLEALPFLLIGSLLGSLIEAFLPDRLFRKKLFGSKILGPVFSIILGFILPTCECGVIPIVRKLVKKGMPEHLAVIYMLTSPVINPIVIISTFIAFRSNWLMVMARVSVAVFVAVVVGILLSKSKKSLFSGLTHGPHCDCGHIHEPGKDEHSKNNFPEKSGYFEKITGIINHAAAEFLEMSRYLIIGAFIAGAFRVFIPKNIIWFFEPNLLLSILFMMVLAIILSICSREIASIPEKGLNIKDEKTTKLLEELSGHILGTLNLKKE